MEKVRFVSDQIRSRKYCYSVFILPTMSNDVAPGITGAQLFLKELIRWMKASHPEHLIKVLIKIKGDGGHHLLLCLMNPKL